MRSNRVSQADGRALFVYWKHDGGAVSNRLGRREATRGGAAERHRAHRQCGARFLRAPADAGDRLRPAGAHHVQPNRIQQTISYF